MSEELINNPEQLLKERLREHIAKTRYGTLRAKEFNSRPSEQKNKETLANISVDNTRISIDSLWVESMISAGIPPDKILKVWDLKDQNNRELKDRISPDTK